MDTRIAAIGQSIMQQHRPRSLMSPMQFALTMKVHDDCPGLVNDLFDTFRAFCSIRMCVIYRKDALSFASGHQNGFLVEVSNRNYTHGDICIPRLRLGHKYT